MKIKRVRVEKYTCIFATLTLLTLTLLIFKVAKIDFD